MYTELRTTYMHPIRYFQTNGQFNSFFMAENILKMHLALKNTFGTWK